MPYLPVDHTTRPGNCGTVHSRLSRAKGEGQRQAGSTVMSAGNYCAQTALSCWLIRLLTRLPQRGVVTLATNVRGPHRRLTSYGHDVERILPIPPIALRLRTGVAVLSYADDLVFGITARTTTSARCGATGHRDRESGAHWEGAQTKIGSAVRQMMDA